MSQNGSCNITTRSLEIWNKIKKIIFFFVLVVEINGFKKKAFNTFKKIKYYWITRLVLRVSSRWKDSYKKKEFAGQFAFAR